MNPSIAKRLAVSILIGMLAGQICLTTVGRVTAAEQGSNQPSEVSQLIERLGSANYATRLRAKEKLERMGLEAFDELHAAQFHTDSEIAMAARHLVSSLLVSWSKESDPPEVREALDEYGAQTEDERSSRIEMLAELPDRKGLIALVRLARFETSLRLSRRAALVLMRQPMSTDPVVRQHHAQHLIEVLDSNDRQASHWLRTYAEDLSDGGYSADRWRELIGQQRLQIDSAVSQESTRPSVLELVRVCAVRAVQSEQMDEALALANSNLDLIPPTTRDLIDACSWAIDNNLHPFVLDLQRQHERMFNQQPILLYGAAEATNVGGDSEQAGRLAERASQIKPLPGTEAERDKMSPKEIGETAEAHREIGLKLQERGLFRWAEREFRQIIDSMEVASIPAATARVHLADMLGELQRYEDAVAILSPLTDRIEKDDKFRQRLNSIFFSYGGIRSDQEFYGGLLKIEKKDLEGAKLMLRRAFRMNPENIDILIAMYRLKSDDEWNELVLDTLRRTIHSVELDVRSAELQQRQLGRKRTSIQRLAHELNQYAWLVSNTEGDYRKALEYSQRSLELNLDGAKLDTCARCYFALGDVENAIRMQRRALKLMPHSPPMIRQLAEFEAKLESEP